MKRKKIKEVVIGKNRAVLLTPYWTAKLLDKKNIPNYFYSEILDDEVEEYKLLNIKDLKDDFKTWCRVAIVSTKYLGESIKCEEYNNLCEESFLNYSNYFENREDADLIKIAKEINDTSIVKIVKIPSNVKYKITFEDNTLNEVIVEKHRIWK